MIHRHIPPLFLILMLPSGLALAADGDGNAGALSLLAPLIAIAMAFITKRVLLSLATGALIASLVGHGFSPVDALLAFVGFIWSSVSDADHFMISAFTVMVAAMVGLTIKSGAMHKLVGIIQRVAKGPRGAVVATWLSGVVVFFDDYANCLIVGNAMGPLVDKFKVSRAKLAYVVDSTAAPVATLAIISTWVGFQVTEMDKALVTANVDTSTVTAFGLFVKSLPYSFYSWFTLIFVGSIAITGRDFGPMLQEEIAARQAPNVDFSALESKGAGWMAALPIALLVILTFAWLIITGRQELGDAAIGAPLYAILEQARAYESMIVGAVAALSLAFISVVGTKTLSLSEAGGALWYGIKPVGEALLVLYLAWTLGDAISSTGAAPYLAAILEGKIGAEILPATIFLLSAGIAFATGSSFSTMAILIPLAVPLAIAVTGDPLHGVVAASAAAVLTGSVLGDHASPISDTTVLSSAGANVNLLVHVKTQIPYALTSGAVALVVGFIPAGYGVNPWILILIGGAIVAAIVRFIGKRPEVAAQS